MAEQQQQNNMIDPTWTRDKETGKLDPLRTQQLKSTGIYL